MKNILIVYSNAEFKNSAWRIVRQARKLNFFDKIIQYSPKDLPLPVKASPLFLFRRGGGYMIWKPYIVKKTLDEAEEGDVVYYIDSGCRIQPSDDWAFYREQIKDHDAIFFSYRDDYDYGYSRWGVNSVKIRHWCKPATEDYFRKYFKNDDFLDENSLWSGFCIFKKCEAALALANEWLEVYLFHPELMVDAVGAEKHNMPDHFNAHRHDQTTLTHLVTFHRTIGDILVLPETAECNIPDAAVVAERYREPHRSWLSTLKFKLYYLLHEGR